MTLAVAEVNELLLRISGKSPHSCWTTNELPISSHKGRHCRWKVRLDHLRYECYLNHDRNLSVDEQAPFEVFFIYFLCRSATIGFRKSL